MFDLMVKQTLQTHRKHKRYRCGCHKLQSVERWCCYTAVVPLAAVVAAVVCAVPARNSCYDTYLRHYEQLAFHSVVRLSLLPCTPS